MQMQDKLHGQLAMRALLTTDNEGRFRYRSVAPRSYPVPNDGPCGEILRAANRSPMRPEHLHFRLHAEGFEPLITMLVRSDDPYVKRDAVFGVRRSLVVDFVQRDAGESAATCPQPVPGADLLPDDTDTESHARMMLAGALCTVTSLVGAPAVSVPTGFADGMPQGVQLIGQMYREDRCLGAAEVIERHFGVLAPIDPRP